MFFSDLIINFKRSKNHTLSVTSKSSNRINIVGDGLEAYVAELFSNSLDCKEEDKQNKILNYFSFLGSQNNPPDMMIKGGPAIEVKKISSLNADLALNSSYPMSKIFADDSKIIAKCRKSEEWTEKDMLYAIGVVKEKNLEVITFVSGSLLAANNNFYSEYFDELKKRILSTKNTHQNSLTTELARFNKIDPLKRTHLRVRAMWIIENPLVTFADSIPREFLTNNQVKPKGIFILDENQFSNEDLKRLKKENIKWTQAKLPDPDNSANQLNALIFTL